MQTFAQTVEDYLTVAGDFYKDDRDYFVLTPASHQQKLLVDLLINATNYDTQNPIPYIQTRTRMLQEPVATGVFDLGTLCLQEKNSQTYLQTHGAIGKTKSNLEGPYRFEIAIDDQEQNRFKLPCITFGLDGKTAYVYSVQNKNPKQDNPLAKKLDRHFRKVNKDIDPEDQISQISPNALVSLTIFNSFLKQLDVEHIYAPDYLPIRYLSNLDAQLHRVNAPQAAQEVVEKQNKNQYNMTDKFYNLFLRYNHHFEQCPAEYSDLTNLMHLKLSRDSSEQNDSNIIYAIDAHVDASEYKQLLSATASQTPQMEK